MSAYFAHALEMNREEVISFAPSETLALVDVETYQSFVGKRADALDMMVHLQNQMNALTAFAWDMAGRSLNLRLRLILTGNHNAMERITFANRPPSASGTVRTHGDLCLVGHDRLLDCARHPKHSLLKGDRVPKEGRPHLFHIPPGILYILAYYRFPYPDGNHPSFASQAGARHDYTVFLHHYPHPAPRVAPVRLPSRLIPHSGEEAAGHPWSAMLSAEQALSTPSS
jgi:hypothetical protein